MNKERIIKKILCFIMGGLVFGTIGVYAATSIASGSVNDNNFGTVEDALDYLYNKMDEAYVNPLENERPTNFLCNGTTEPTTSSPTSFPSGKTIFLGLYSDTQLAVCIKTNNSLFGTQCFRYLNWIVEKKHLQTVFEHLGGSCSVSSDHITCSYGQSGTGHVCNIYSKGEVQCNVYLKPQNGNARIYSSGKYTRGVTCN